jgi:hypothetical protein
MPTQTGATVAAGRVNCPSCAAALTVRAELAGRNIKCRCGRVFAAPSMAEMAEAASRAAAEMALARGYAPARKRIDAQDDHPAPKGNFVLDIALPTVLLPAGVVLCLVQAAYFDKDAHRLAEVIGPTMLGIVASLGLMVVAVLAAGLALGMVFHAPPWQTALKICGIALIPSAVGAIVDHAVGGINGNIFGVLSAVALYTGLVKVILRMPWDYTAIIVFTCWTIRAFTLYAIYKFQGATGGHWI